MNTEDTLSRPKTEQAPEKPPAKNPQGTEYVVLRASTASGAAGDWHEHVDGTVHASSAADAVRKGAAGKEGVYVAVPARSFHPVKVKVQTTTHVALEDV